MFVVEVNQLIAVHAVEGQQDQHDEVGNQQRKVEGIGVIQALERRVEKMSAQVVAESPRFHQYSAQHHERSVQERAPVEKSRRRHHLTRRLPQRDDCT